MDPYPSETTRVETAERRMSPRSLVTVTAGALLALVIGLGAAGATLAADEGSPSPDGTNQPSATEPAATDNGNRNGGTRGERGGKLCDKDGDGVDDRGQGAPSEESTDGADASSSDV